jgi:superoxide dismutase, Fe-Mn family
MNESTKRNLHSAQITLKHHQLPPLNYGYDALEPYIDARTMKLHHDIHHRAYVEKLNMALDRFPEFRDRSAYWLMCNLSKLPREIRTEVHHNAGGHINHSLLWHAMKPGVAGEPNGRLREAIIRSFGSFAKFKTRFEEEAAKLFGSGWVWLVRTPQDGGKLEVITTSNHDSPMMQGSLPILLNDVWEHAYYLHYENRRPDYLNAWWAVVDWEEAAHRFELSDETPAEELCETEAGCLLAIDKVIPLSINHYVR